MTFQAAALTAFAAAQAAASAAALPAGDLEILDAGGVVLIAVPLGTPTAAGALLTGGGFPKSATAAAAGTASTARLRTSSGTTWKTGITVGLAGSGAQVILSSMVVASGQTVQVSGFTLSHAATAA